MPRVKRGVPGAKRRKKVLKRAKGYFGGRSKLHSVAVEAVEKADKYAYRDRRQRKREFRALWIARINAAASRIVDSGGTFLSSSPTININFPRR